MVANVPRYVSPQERAENRARIRKAILGVLIAIPAVVALLMYGYSDQAPEWLRRLSLTVDGLFGHPVLWLIKTLMAG